MNKATKYVFVLLNNKGGVGKSRTAVSFSEYLTENKIRHHLIDADLGAKGTGSLKRYFPETEQLVVAADITGRRLWDRLVEATGRSNVVVADLPGQATADFVSWIRESDVPANLGTMGVQMVLVVPVCDEFASVEALKVFWDDVGPDAHKAFAWVVVMNWKDGKPLMYLNSGFREGLRAAGVEEMDFARFAFDPDMNRALTCKNNEDGTLEFWPMTKLIESRHFGVLSTSRLKHFRDRLFDEFSKLNIVQALKASGAGAS